MEGLVLCLAALCVCCFPAVSHSQLYTLISPNVLRVENEEKIVVEAHGLSTSIEVTIFILDFPLKRQNLFQVTTSLNPENGMMGTAVIKVPAHAMRVDSKQNQYVVVQAQFPQQTLEKVILVHFHSGYIFIQTDKIIYKPQSTVLVRFFTVGHKLEPVNKRFVYQFETSEGNVVSQRGVYYTFRGIFSQGFPLREVTSLGTWKIVAWYEDSPQQNFSTQFDVKEYVLPDFEVTLEPSDKFIYIDDNKDLKVSINARFADGKQFYGTAFVLFGVKQEDERISISESFMRVPIIDGTGEAVLTRVTLQARFHNLSEILGHSIYVSVTVLTDSGTKMVEAENIKVVSYLPYKIHFTNTPKYFKPGMPFELMISVTNPDGTPAANVPLKVETSGLQDSSLIQTMEDGTAKLKLKTAVFTAQLQILVRTALKNKPENHQASKSMVAEAYQTQGGSENYLHLLVSATEVQPRDNLLVSFNVKTNSPDDLNQIQYITYLILNKGMIIRAGRQAKGVGQTSVTMTLPITQDLMPAFRIVGYYHVRQKEIVADSVWIDVKGTCMGTLVIKAATVVDNRIHRPAHVTRIKIEGDARASVALVALDKRLSFLNKRRTIAQTQIWDAVENNDIGCTPGSGKDNLGVFTDAGLALVTNVKISTPTRTDPKCPQPPVFRQRAVQISKGKKVAWHQDENLRRCCEDGMHENPMGHSCEKRAQYIWKGEQCKTMFLNCCNYVKMVQEKQQGLQLETSSDLDDDFLSNEDIFSRNIFMESWLWQTEKLSESLNRDGISSRTLPLFLKDSITTWQVLAVSLSQTSGICVADPYEIMVTKELFIELQLPYSAVRNEPVEIQAILHNNQEQDIKVQMELMYNAAFCSPSSSKVNYQQIINIRARSSKAIPLVIVPLQLGFHDIEIIAAQSHSLVADGVKKKLNVVPEGTRLMKTMMSILLDPAREGIDGVQELKVKAVEIDDMVPDTELLTRILFQGRPVVRLMEEPIKGASLKQLIIKPLGNGEFNIMQMSTAVVITHYLDITGQWDKIGVDHWVEALSLITQGYMQQLAFKKPDQSYAATTNRPSSTWLTAYVAKVFAMATTQVPIESQGVCGAVRWLCLEKQKPDGAFKEDTPVIHREMVGGYQGGETDVSLTAFVLIAILESKAICEDHLKSFDRCIRKAGEYLSGRYSSLARPYTVAISSYALILLEMHGSEKVLMGASKDGNRWEEQGTSTFSIEGTSYALLALLSLKRFDLAGPVVRWLTQQTYDVGNSIATTIMFQALAQYHRDALIHEDLQLNVSLLLPLHSKWLNYRIQHTDMHLTRIIESKLNENFTIRAQGNGQGTLTVIAIYNARLQEDKPRCKSFDLRVSVQEAPNAKKADGILCSISIEICTRYLDVTDSTMAVLNVTIPTGFLPSTEDLTRLSQGADRYVFKYEMNKILLDEGHLIIYLDKVSHKDADCLRFKAHQFFEVGLIKPLTVMVYDYYSLGNNCTKFYQLPESSRLLSKFFNKDVRQCTEENCFKQKTALNSGSVMPQTRLEQACKSGVDFVYKTRLLKTEESSGYNNYMMEILEVLKAGTDKNSEGQTRVFISHAKCREVLKLELNSYYLIWGPRTDLWALGTSISYVISKDTWIEEWPSENKCQEAAFKNLCIEYEEFSQAMMIFGCPEST